VVNAGDGNSQCKEYQMDMDVDVTGVFETDVVSSTKPVESWPDTDDGFD